MSFDDFAPSTTFANGINPFAGLMQPQETTMATPQIPAKPAHKASRRARTDEDFSTPYQPPVTAAPIEPKPLPPRVDQQPNRAPKQHRDISRFVICDDPVLPRRVIADSIYGKLFSELKPGKCIKCDTKDVGPTCNALRKYVEEKKLSGVAVRSTRDYGDGFGRVFLVKVA